MEWNCCYENLCLLPLSLSTPLILPEYHNLSCFSFLISDYFYFHCIPRSYSQQVGSQGNHDCHWFPHIIFLNAAVSDGILLSLWCKADVRVSEAAGAFLEGFSNDSLYNNALKTGGKELEWDGQYRIVRPLTMRQYGLICWDGMLPTVGYQIPLSAG